MSHYSVMVCLPRETVQADIEGALEKVLAPFDENMRVEPYRRYEDESAEEYWWTRSMRADVAGWERLVVKGEDAITAELLADFRAKAKEWDRETPEEKAANELADYRWAGERDTRILESPMSWKTLVELYNERWHPANALAVPGEEADDDERLLYEEETDRAYTMSTYNPESKWDYWRIGGRWSGYFIADGMEEFILLPERHWDGPKDLGRGRCDGGRIRSLNLAAMREEVATKANADYDRWEKLVAEHGADGKPWSHFTGLIDVVEGYTIEQARQEYHAQPIVVAHDRLERNNEGLAGWGDCVVDTFLPPREEFVRLRVAAAVPAYATVSLAGEWIAPGRMGWFGMSSDGPGEREGYQIAVSKYLQELHPDTWLVVVDCHI